MRFAVRNPYDNGYAGVLVQRVLAQGLLCFMQLSKMELRKSKLRECDSVLRSIAYDEVRHEFYFKQDIRFRQMYYNDTVPVLRSWVSSFLQYITVSPLVGNLRRFGL